VSQPVATQKTEKRVPGIDLLRGLCIVAVVLHHINLSG
jgi:peptidoglycan/LPS O-acetylase OafA/YrhL